MQNFDLHSALKKSMIATGQAQGLSYTYDRLQWSKEDAGNVIHFSPNSYSGGGLQLPDLLSLIGCRRQECSHFPGGAYCARVSDGLNAQKLAADVLRSFELLKQAQRDLTACGLDLPQPEGWAHFTGGSAARRNVRSFASGDGHRSPEHQRLCESADDSFRYAFSWIKGGSDKGWVSHISPKHPPLSNEVKAAFDLIGLRSFDQCPEFDFEPCYWTFRPYSNDFMSANFAHDKFGQFSSTFSIGLSHLLEAHSVLLPHGFELLKIPKGDRIRSATNPKSSSACDATMPENFDVAVSFAGTDREIASQLAGRVRDAGFKVFYDDFYPEHLWGKNLAEEFHQIYSSRARFVVILVSQAYTSRMWTNHERRSAQEKALKEFGQEYVLPIKLDESELEGFPATVGYLSLKQYGLEKTAELLIKKLRLDNH